MKTRCICAAELFYWISTAFLVRMELARFTHDVRNLGQKKLLQGWRERNRCIEGGDSHDWRVKRVEDFFVNDGGYFAGQAPGARVFMENDYLVCVLNRRGNRLTIQGRYRAQVDNFDVNTIFQQDLCRFERNVEHGSVGDDAEVATFARHPGLAQRHDVILGRHVFLNAPI